MEQVDTHGLGCDFIIADRLERTAVRRVDQEDDNGYADCRSSKDRNDRLEGRIGLEQVGTVGDRAKRIPLDNRADNLGKAEGSDGQIVALESEHRHANQPGEQRGQKAGCDDAGDGRQGEIDDTAVIILIDGHALVHRNGKYGIGIRAYKHEARLAQGEQAREAVQQVHGDGDQRIDRALLEHGNEHGTPAEVLLEEIQHDKHQRNKRDIDEVFR